MMAADTFGFCSTQATASWARLSPASSAIGRSCCTRFEHVVVEPARDEAGAAVLVGRAGARRRRLTRRGTCR